MRPWFLWGCALLSLLAVWGLLLAIAKERWWLLPLPMAAFVFAEINLRRAS